MQYVVTMGQNFRGALERALRELGAVIVRAQYVDGSTRWQVLARFPARTRQRDVTQLLWAKWPDAAVTVEPVGEREEETRPPLTLVGRDGNAFMVLGLAFRAAKKAGWSQARIADYKQKATSGDYNNLLAVTQEFFAVQ